jgi:hypothetical protein
LPGDGDRDVDAEHAGQDGGVADFVTAAVAGLAWEELAEDYEL